MKTAFELAEEYATLVRAKLGLNVKRIVLFGSQARGDATEKSDYDFVVILNTKSVKSRNLLIEVGVEMLNRYDRLFGALVYDEQEWSRARCFPLGWSIEQEGIAI